jgi:hypothetical protein
MRKMKQRLSDTGLMNSTTEKKFAAKFQGLV